MSYVRRRLFSQDDDDTSASIVAGTPATGVTGTDYVVGRDIVTVLTFTNLQIGNFGNVGAEDIASGVLIYTFPAGAHVHTATYMSITIAADASRNGTTPDIGIGSVVAVGAVATLDGTSTFENYITGQAGTVNGVAAVKTSVATAGALTGISINEAGSTKAMYLNVAGNWQPALIPQVTTSGTVTIKWTKMS